jgi:flagellar hook-associated protein 2
MSDLGLSGIASGVDTAAIIDKLMQLERNKTTRIQLRQTAVEARKTDLSTIAGKLSTLKSAAADLASSATWGQKQTIESSDPARVAVEKISGAGIGGHSISVTRLAASAQRTFSWPVAAGGALTADTALSVTGATSGSITLTAGMKLSDAVTAINANESLPVYAAEVNGELVLSARTTGAGSVFTASGLTETGTAKITNLDATYEIDGVQKSSPDNVVDEAIPGLRLTLKGLTSAPAGITVGAPALDKEAVKAKLNAFVTAYNGVIDATNAELTERPVANATSSVDARKGQLYGDIGLKSMLSQMRQFAQDSIAGLGNGSIDSLVDLGIGVPKSTGGQSTADAKAGKLVIDETKLSAALEADWTQVRTFFADSTKGFSKVVDDFVGKQTGSTTALLDGRTKTADEELRRLSDTLTRTNTRLEAQEKRLKAQFAAMETALGLAQSQQAWLAGQIAGLPTYS